MSPIVEDKSKEVQELCRKFRVERLDVFGSAATGSFDSDSSDLDFLVNFKNGTPGQHSDSYFGLLFGLEDLFRRHIDLVEEGAIENPYFRETVEASRAPVYVG